MLAERHSALHNKELIDPILSLCDGAWCPQRCSTNCPAWACRRWHWYCFGLFVRHNFTIWSIPLSSQPAATNLKAMRTRTQAFTKDRRAKLGATIASVVAAMTGIVHLLSLRANWHGMASLPMAAVRLRPSARIHVALGKVNTARSDEDC